ncbi:MAG: sigma-70 family RNA polymerase sigma factor [Bacilli bacterium]
MLNLENTLIQNEALVRSIAYNYKNKDMDDLLQAGRMGLINAYNNYDENQNTKFSSYAYLYIMGEISKCAREDVSIKIPKDIYSLRGKIMRVSQLLEQEYNRPVTFDEIANFLEIDKGKIQEVMSYESYTQSLDKSTNNDDGNEISLYEKIGNSYDSLDDLIDLENSIMSLEEPQKSIMLARLEDKSQSEIAQMLGLSQVNVSRNETKARAKILKMCA